MKDTTKVFNGLSFGDYQDLAGMSRSDLELYIESPQLYHGTKVTKIYKTVGKPHLRLGTILHAVVAEGHQYKLDDYAVDPEYRDTPPEFIAKIPADVLTSNGQKRGNKWKAWSEEHAGLLQLKDHEYDDWKRYYEEVRGRPDLWLVNEREEQQLTNMLATIERHPIARQLLDGGRREMTVVWECEETGVLRRCRLDNVLARLIVDLKSTQSVAPGSFAKSIEEYGYHRQAAWYIDGWKAATGEELPFVFLASQKKEPYSAAAYTLTPNWLERGRAEIRDYLERFKVQDWDLLDYSEEIIELAEPRWAKYQNEYAMEEAA